MVIAKSYFLYLSSKNALFFGWIYCSIDLLFTCCIVFKYIWKIKVPLHRVRPAYRNQSNDSQDKPIDWFLYDSNFGV